MKKIIHSVKSSIRQACVMASITVLAASIQSATAQSIGCKFTIGSAGGIDNTDVDSMLPTDLAGAPPYAQTNWNNLSSASSIGANTNVPPNGFLTLTDSQGNVDTLNVQWNDWATVNNGTYSALGTPDGNLFDEGISTWGPGSGPGSLNSSGSLGGQAGNNQPIVYLSGLNAWWTSIPNAEGYGVVLYTIGSSYWESVEGYIESASGDPATNGMVEGSILTPQLFEVDNGVFSGTYVPTTGTSSSSPTYGANYMFFPGLTNDTILLRLGTPNYGAALDAFQLVPMYPSAPTNATATLSPGSPVYAKTPVTLSVSVTGDAIHTNLWYQWQTDNGSGGPATNNILDATNATYTFTPSNSAAAYNLQFQVLVTNVFGACTSPVVTLTVNPAVAPYLTEDTTPGTGNALGGAYAYVNGDMTFNAAFGGSLPIAYQWQVNTGGSYTNIVGATNSTLILTNLQAAGTGNYQLVADNFVGTYTSTPSFLTVLPDPAAPNSSVAYPYAVLTDDPAAYWRLNETLNNQDFSVQAYDYSGHNLNATYGIEANDDETGPASPTYPGFESANTCAEFYNAVANSWIAVPSLNLNTNTVTITAWINPGGTVGSGSGLFVWRGTNGEDAAGFNFGPSVNNNSVAELGYIWNSNSPSTYNFNSALYPPQSQWSFVALTITPTNSALYLYYLNGSTPVLSKAVQTITNQPETFSGGAIYVGSDPNNSSGDSFNGSIGEVAIFAQSLSESQLQALYLNKALGIGGVAPTLQSEPWSFNNWEGSNLVLSAIATFAGQPVVLSAEGVGYPTPNYQWQGGTDGVFSNLSNNGRISGVNSGALTINPTAVADAMEYQLVLANSYGSVTSSLVTLGVTPVPANGLWTVNFAPGVTGNSYPGTVYSGHGVLGSGTFWNSLSGGNWANSTAYCDNGATPSGIDFSCTNYPGSWFSGFPMNNGLLDPYVDEYSASGVTASGFVFTNVPNGTYNLAVYGMSGSIIGSQGATHVGTTFSVNGLSQNLVNAQDVMFAQGDNTALFTGIAVTNGSLNLAVIPNPYPGTEWDFNGVQLQAVNLAPVVITTALGGSGSSQNLTLTWANYGTLMSATNLAGPWVPVTGAISPFVVSTTNTAEFFSVKLP